MTSLYPYKIQIIKHDSVLVNYCGVKLWSKWRARVKYYNEGTKIKPRVIMAIYIQHPDAPRGEVRLHDWEVRFLNGLPKPHMI